MTLIDPIQDGQSAKWHDPRRQPRQARPPARGAARPAATPTATIGEAWAAHLMAVETNAWKLDERTRFDGLEPAMAEPPSGPFPYDDPAAWRLTISMYYEHQPTVAPDEPPGAHWNVTA